MGMGDADSPGGLGSKASVRRGGVCEIQGCKYRVRDVFRRLFAALARRLPRGAVDFMPPGDVGWYSSIRRSAPGERQVTGTNKSENDGGDFSERGCTSVQAVAEGLTSCMCQSQAYHREAAWIAHT